MQQNETSSTPLGARILGLVLGSEVVAVVAEFVLPRVAGVLARPQGMYEVLDYQAELELKDGEGHEAVVRKQQSVRYLQDYIIAYQDQAWGDGEIFADYKCSPGVPVDTYRDGNTYRVLISLREAKSRGDEDTFHIERTVRDGFTRTIEDFQIDVDHRCRRLTMAVIFPPDRLPKTVKLIEHRDERTAELTRQGSVQLADGRHKYEWRTNKPKTGAEYGLRWEW